MTSKQINDNEQNLQAIIGAFPPYGKKVKDYTAKELSQRTAISENVINSIIAQNTNIFLWLTSKRFTLIPLIFKVIRDLFETKHYSLLNVELECLPAVRQAYNVKTINSTGIKNILSAFGEKLLKYEDFVANETKYYDCFNLVAPDARKIPADYYLNIFLNRSGENYIGELNTLFSNDDRAIKMLILKYSGETLNEIGTKEKISREYVRKLIEEPAALVTMWVYKYEWELIRKYLSADGSLSESAVLADIPADQWSVIKKVIIDNSDNLRFLKYDETLDVIFKDIYGIDNVISSVDPEKYSYIAEYIEEIVPVLNDSGYKFINKENAEKFLSGKHVMLPSGIHAGSHVTFTSILPTLIKTYFPEGVKISDEAAINKIAELANSEYGITIKGNNPVRNITAKIQSTCYLIDRGTYSAAPPPAIPPSLMKKIYDFVSTSQTDLTSYSSLFEAFKKEFTDCGITSAYIMHGALKKSNNYPDLTLIKDYVSISHNSSQGNFEPVRKYLAEIGRPISTDDILNKFPSVSQSDLRLLSIYYPQITKWDKCSYYNVEGLPVSSEMINKFKSAVKELTNNDCGYTSEYALHSKIESECPDILAKLGITDASQTFSVVSWFLINDFSFSSPHILKEHREERFTTNMLIALCIGKLETDTFSRKELTQKVASVYGRISSTIHLAINKVLSSYVRISADCYCPMSKLSLDDTKLDKINAFIKKNIKLGNGTFAIGDIKQYLRELPDIDIEWTVFVLSDIIRIKALPYTTSIDVHSKKYSAVLTITSCHTLQP